MSKGILAEYTRSLLTDCQEDLGEGTKIVVHEERLNTIVVEVNPRSKRAEFREYCAALPYVEEVYNRGEDLYFFSIRFAFVPPVNPWVVITKCCVLVALSYCMFFISTLLKQR